MEKKFYIFAGVNGAGKSTLYRILSTCYKNTDFGERINTDEIVNEIGDWKNPKDQITAARIGLSRRKEYIEKGITFNQETTLTGNRILKTIEEVKNSGYKIIMNYVGVEKPEISIERIKVRVSRGGHHIPDNVVEKRYYESLKNLEKIACLCDELRVYDNSGNHHLLCLYKKSDIAKSLIPKENFPKWLNEIKIFS